jgi:hypothetical protein
VFDVPFGFGTVFDVPFGFGTSQVPPVPTLPPENLPKHTHLPGIVHSTIASSCLSWNVKVGACREAVFTVVTLSVHQHSIVTFGSVILITSVILLFVACPLNFNCSLHSSSGILDIFPSHLHEKPLLGDHHRKKHSQL